MGTLQRYMGGVLTDTSGDITTKYGEPRNIVVTFNRDVLQNTEYTYANISDISMNLKLNPYTDADDAYLEKKETTSGVEFDSQYHRFTMIIKEEDYTNLEYKTYYICINVEISYGTTDSRNKLNKWIEIDRKGVLNRTVEIVKDTNRQ